MCKKKDIVGADKHVRFSLDQAQQLSNCECKLIAVSVFNNEERHGDGCNEGTVHGGLSL